MRITIITAVFNGGIAIVDTLNSIAAQDFPDIEHIVVDGASSDSTLHHVQAHSARVAAVISEPDRGVYDAFNKGLRHASGDVIGFLNCGDVYTSSDAVSQLAAALDDERVQAVFADVSIVDPGNPERILRHFDSKRFQPARMPYGLMPAHPTLLLRRDVYDQVGPYDTQFTIAGDFELCLRVFAKRQTPYRHIPKALVRMPAGGLSNRGWRSKWTITKEMRRACLIDDVSTNVVKLLMRFPLKLLEMR